MGTGTRRGWFILRLLSGNPTQMDVDFLALRIDTMKLIKDYLKRVPPRMVTSHRQKMPSFNGRSIRPEKFPFTGIGSLKNPDCDKAVRF
ncbi:MAG: hypothetical protein NPIRA03_26530 [Nitrospirales bacterium]|nr:MAG: hypothetical protein NPIRA03_26530 [Nitrospirales bacterium]